ncbi:MULTISPECIES: ProQ/FINO family protein [unclassified Cobetia]|uniref:ProQ/FINO family protein n=1 Tax=unclassified Cobetia TaxID=2609414 RepID=UPI0020978166|nr:MULTISPECIES: ProQ/FINO family protein [unclassified Cobetia]MCO7231312.1 ProQ/FINO family protein [Cobetia sp. Dlab-2-AX]MCO7234279.1 ProQ/FINO family protein [Cobetia sp. Dlab-2-U]
MDRLEALYSALEHEADTQRQQRDTERRARTALESENARLRDALAQLEQQAASAATADADAHQRALADAERALAAERREREQLAEQLAAARQTLQEQQAQLNAVNEALLARDAQLRELAEQASAPQPSTNAESVLAAQQEAQAERLASERMNVSQPAADAQTAAAADSSEAQAPQAQVPQEQEAHQQNEAEQGEAPQAQQASQPESAPSPHALLKQWYKRYPDTFFKGHTRPLKIGIHIELLENEPWDDKLVRRALAGYVHLPRYLKAVRAGTQRVDLSGQSVGAVTEDEARHARQQLDELTRQQKAREEQATDQRISHKLSELMTKHRP